MAWAALVIALAALALHFIPRRPKKTEAEAPMFSLPLIQKREARRPKVRDELAGWRVEQEERYEWEARLREKER